MSEVDYSEGTKNDGHSCSDEEKNHPRAEPCQKLQHSNLNSHEISLLNTGPGVL
jgi:hypothetical protein